LTDRAQGVFVETNFLHEKGEKKGRGMQEKEKVRIATELFGRARVEG